MRTKKQERTPIEYIALKIFSLCVKFPLNNVVCDPHGIPFSQKSFNALCAFFNPSRLLVVPAISNTFSGQHRTVNASSFGLQVQCKKVFEVIPF